MVPVIGETRIPRRSSGMRADEPGKRSAFSMAASSAALFARHEQYQKRVRSNAAAVSREMMEPSNKAVGQDARCAPSRLRKGCGRQLRERLTRLSHGVGAEDADPREPEAGGEEDQRASATA